MILENYVFQFILTVNFHIVAKKISSQISIAALDITKNWIYSIKKVRSLVKPKLNYKK